MTTTPHIHRRHVAPLLALVALFLSLPAGSHAAAAHTASDPYGWPVKPFDRPHAIRGSFGDPRTVFAGPPTKRTLLGGGGAFSFHFGVDIAAPDGTAVYPVESGTVMSATKDWIAVAGPNGRSFQYWHIAPSVAVGDHVAVDATVLGHILRSCGHVHLTEIDGNGPVNPLQPGHLTPYADTTTPTVAAITFRKSVTAAPELPELLRGRVEIVAAAQDLPAVPVAGPWHDLPVTPAVVEWAVRTTDGRTVVPTRIAYDVRSSLPPTTSFWRTYARGTHQNMAVFGKHYSFMQPGEYLFRLAPGGFDTRTLRDGLYELVVTASDIAGNHGSLTQRFSVHNKPGVVGP